MPKLYNFWTCYSVATSALTGAGTINVQIPGTYTGITPADAGRTIISGMLAFASPSMGDKITSISVTDTNSIMPANDQVFFPSYPTLGVYGDPASASGNKVMFLTPSGGGWTNFVPAVGPIFIPSQMFINIVLQKASIISDTAYLNLLWQSFQ